ncbi:MAG: molybdopterin-dependent oxidoreductase, partial [Chloroflexi bacterium]|nr:molybdopterin-dependent oxidoreductase [Chloroflexota bacterium]
MELTLNVNGKKHTVEVSPDTSLLDALRELGYMSVKQGCEEGVCGACTVLFDGKPVYSCSVLAAQAEGHEISTAEALGGQETGWDFNLDLHPLQEAFVETGAVQCGFCTPAMLMTAKHLLDENPDPTEEEVRDALSGVICRCTGYEKPVKAVMLAAARMRGDEEKARQFAAEVVPEVYEAPEVKSFQRVGKPERKVDALKLVQGKPAFVDDFNMPGMLIAKVLRSPVAHARIKRIDTSKAKALPGVHAVLTWEDLPRVPYSTAGQSDPIPGPLDTFSLDNKVRFVGDRVAFVAAETEEIADQALKLIEVEYEELPPIVDPEDALKEDAPIIHDEPEYVPFGESDPTKNIAARIRIDIGNVEKGFEDADYIFEGEYEVPRAHQAYVEPHIAITYWDENDRLVIRTSTQVPFHVRRQLAPVLNLPIKKIHVVKPRIGGGFGGKQEVLMEDVPAHLTIATGRPVKYIYTDEEEFIAARPRHAMKIRLKTGVKKDGTITANEMYALSNTGAYGGHALTVAGNTGHKAMALYVGDGEYRKNPNIRFYADVVYTNTVPAGAYRG